MSTSRLAAIAFRGIYLARILRERGVVVIETYPRALVRALGVDETSGKNPAAARRALADRISGLTIGRPDELDAIAAALAAAEYAVAGDRRRRWDDLAGRRLTHPRPWSKEAV
jgi:predicted nuclease with RNAse H fold